MKTTVWNWIQVVGLLPGMWLFVVLMSPLLAALAAYDLVFLAVPRLPRATRKRERMGPGSQE